MTCVRQVIGSFHRIARVSLASLIKGWRSRALPFCHLRLKVLRRPGPDKWKCTQTAAKYPKIIGEHLKRRRLELHLMQAEVAKRLGVHKGSIQNWERGVGTPADRYHSRSWNSLARRLKLARRPLTGNGGRLWPSQPVEKRSIAEANLHQALRSIHIRAHAKTRERGTSRDSYGSHPRLIMRSRIIYCESACIFGGSSAFEIDGPIIGVIVPIKRVPTTEMRVLEANVVQG